VTKKPSLKKYLVAGTLGLGATGAMAMAMIVPEAPARAQWTVFDPSNYSQNILTAARTLTQINNQIAMLQSQVNSLINQEKNLTTISVPELQQLQETIQLIDRLMGHAQGIQLHAAGLDRQVST
jgi:P-type conjugative transfer protein TrbJ